jgi:phage-related minor tail protein
MADDANDAGDLGTDALASGIEGVRTRTRDLTAGSNAFARAITAAFAQGATGAKTFDSVLKSLALRLSTLSLNLALKPVISGLTSGLTNLFSGLGTSAGADGAANEGPVQPFARGGVIATPSFFPLGGSRVGLAGEAGPEAIMPLARGPDGRLGVTASGAASNVTINIATPDAESFRRSETYLTGLIARAVARGQRGL